jgi:hypothetical protein
MTAFRDAIAERVYYQAVRIDVADAVLAMPEMQAIRAALRSLADDAGLPGESVAQILRRHACPDSVIVWVLEDQP